MPLAANCLYNELPSLEEAAKRCRSQNITELIEGPIRDAFLRYSAQKAFTLYLQHRHHQLHWNESIVKVHGTAHSMNEDDIKNIESMGNKVVPTTWMGSNMLPMEFAVVPSMANTPSLPPEFIEELTNVLNSNDCKGLFGVDTLLEENWTELTIGGSSVVVPSNGREGEAYIPVAFAFDDEKPGFRVHGKCGTDHKHTSKP